MYISGPNLDDLLRRVYKKILKKGKLTSPSRGDALELTGVLLRLENPRARISRTETRGRMFSCLGELLWYLSGSDRLAQISYYLKEYKKESEDGETIYGAYGPRLLARDGQIDQIENVTRLLLGNPWSRRAVIQLYDAADISVTRKTIPCTCTLQFLVRKGKLDLSVNMRSNDAYMGLAHDIFAFSMLQEIVARKLGVRLGQYKHYVGSLHLYEERWPFAETYLSEGWQSGIEMPPMPKEDPSSALAILIQAESEIRLEGNFSGDLSIMDDYWADLVRLLAIHASFKRKDPTAIETLKDEVTSPVYSKFIEYRNVRLRQSESVNRGSK